MYANKVCPVVLRQTRQTEILLFEHPLAGIQLVKGSIEAGESPQAAAIRELYEEAGISNAMVIRDLGLWHSGHLDQIWSLQLCEVQQSLPDTWIHHCADDGGHAFRFFWHGLHEEPPAVCHPVFQRVLRHLHVLLD